MVPDRGGNIADLMSSYKALLQAEQAGPPDPARRLLAQGGPFGTRAHLRLESIAQPPLLGVGHDRPHRAPRDAGSGHARGGGEDG